MVVSSFISSLLVGSVTVQSHLARRRRRLATPSTTPPAAGRMRRCAASGSVSPRWRGRAGPAAFRRGATWCVATV